MRDYELAMTQAMNLQKYSNLEGTEIGEACGLLIELSRYQDYVSEEFLAALDNEIKDQLEYFEKNSTITTKDITYTHKVTEFEWN